MSLPPAENELSKQVPTEKENSNLADLYQPILRRKTRHYLYLFAFFIIEVGFIILGAVCLAKPIPLNIKLNIKLNLTDAKVKGGFTAVFVVWQNIAVFAGARMTDDAFSREWSAQLDRSAPLEDNGPLAKKVDRVSTVTSGHLGRSLHLLKGEPTKTFTIAFLASLSFLVLKPLAIGVITPSTTLIHVPTTIQIGQLLSHPQTRDIRETFTARDRANIIVRLETLENSTFGFKLQPNMFAPVPNVNLTSFHGSIEYDSDVVEFHHDCHWEASKFSNVSGSVVVASAGQQWDGATLATNQVNRQAGSSIGPLSLRNFATIEQFGKSAFIFSGGNSTVLHASGPSNPVPYAVDLTSLPTTHTAHGAGLNFGSDSLYAPLSSVLVCDPHPQITGGRISITGNKTQSILSFRAVASGNIPRSAVNYVFRNALSEALLSNDVEATNFVNLPASMLFMKNSSSVDWNTAQGIRPLDLPSINQNMDTFMLSAVKAYIDGYTRNESSSVGIFNLRNVSALIHEERFALTTSKPQFIVTVVLVTIATVLLCILCRFSLKYETAPFDLMNVSGYCMDVGKGVELAREAGVRRTV